MVKKPSKILQQLHKKIFEYNWPSPLSNKKATIVGNKCIFRECALSTKTPDKFCYVRGNIPIEIQRISQGDEGVIVARTFNDMQSFYEEPFESKDIGIYMVDPKNYGVEETFLLSDLVCKAVGIPYKNKFILMPMLHFY